MRDFSQQFTSHSNWCLEQTLEWLVREILVIEKNMMGDELPASTQDWAEAEFHFKSQLNFDLEHKVDCVD
ncbi:uncharacterized [Tachysurus ichikawai]